MTLAIEGVASHQWSGATPGSVSITTAGTNRVVVLIAAFEQTSAQNLTSVTAAGLTFTKRGSIDSVDNGGRHNTIECWWAAASAQLTGVAITAAISAAIDDGNLICFAVSGVTNFSNPFDTNASLPKTGGATAAGSPATLTGISTDTANTLLFAVNASRDAAAPTPDTGYTSLFSVLNGGGALFEYTVGEYEVFSAIQSGISVGWGSGSSGGHSAMYVDAFTASAGVVSETGTIDMTLPALVMDVEAMSGEFGTIAMTLPALVMDAQGACLASQIGMTLPLIVMALEGAVEKADIGMTLPLMVMEANGMSGEFGTIAMTLPMLSQVAYGEQLGLPGSGSFYSWWFMGS